MSWILSYGVPIGGLLIVLAIGFVTLFRRLLAVADISTFADEFRNKYLKYVNSRGEDAEAYTWLMLNSNKMQNEMGGYGIYHKFKPPGANYMFGDYPIILNMLPELRRWIDENRHSAGTMFGTTIDSYAKTIDEALLRFLGVVRGWDEEARKKLRNPLTWLRTGIEQVLTVPVFILRSFGLLGAGAVGVVQRNFLFRILALLTTLLAVASGIVTIALGWTETGKLITPWLKQIFVG